MVIENDIRIGGVIVVFQKFIAANTTDNLLIKVNLMFTIHILDIILPKSILFERLLIQRRIFR